MGGCLLELGCYVCSRHHGRSSTTGEIPRQAIISISIAWTYSATFNPATTVHSEGASQSHHLPPHTLPLRCPTFSPNAPPKILLPSPWRRARIESVEALSYEIQKTSPFLPTNPADVAKTSALPGRLHGQNRKPYQPV